MHETVIGITALQAPWRIGIDVGGEVDGDARTVRSANLGDGLEALARRDRCRGQGVDLCVEGVAHGVVSRVGMRVKRTSRRSRRQSAVLAVTLF